MSKPLQRVRGFPDKLPEDSFQFDQILSNITEVINRFNFERIDFPILEYSNLFVKTLGESSDVVNKEMYSFTQSEESLTLRPEGTACVARMFITEKLQRQLPLRFFYHGPMFRHERPQKGRFRQFYQIGAELLGEDNETSDIELLSMVHLIAKKLNISDKVTLEINSIGDAKDRANYKQQLVKYLSSYETKLSSDSQRRLKTNPLRIWDSKEESDKKIMENAPKLMDFLSKDSLSKYENIKKGLKDLGIPFKENFKLVRGLDYYNDLVFELTSEHLGSQSAVLAGGRYNSLIKTLGGPDTAAVGWAAGLERLTLLCEKYKKTNLLIGLVCADEKAQQKAFKIAYELRQIGFDVYYKFSGNFSKQMKRLDQKNCSIALFYGEKEMEEQELTLSLKDLKTGEQLKFKFEDLIKHLLNNKKMQ